MTRVTHHGLVAAALLVSVVAVLGIAPSALALSCAGNEAASPHAIAEGDLVLANDAAFVDHFDGAIFGTVVAITTQDVGTRPDYGRTRVRFELTGVLGNASAAPTVIVQDDPGWLSGYEFELGRHYLVPFRWTESGAYSHLCDPIFEVDPADVPELIAIGEEHAWAARTHLVMAATVARADEWVQPTGDFVIAGPWEGFAAVVAFVGMLVALAVWFRRRERAGDFDPQAPSSAATPGLRRFFDYSEDGFRNDGSRQRPPRR